MSLRIAVISDLHVGAKARRYDFVPGGSARVGERPYIDEFKDFVISAGIRSDYLLVPGDIANEAHPSEYELAAERIVQIAELLGVATEHVAFVPGNHDVSWSVQKLGGAFWQSKKFLPILEVFGPALGFGVDRFSNLFKPPYAEVANLGDLQLVLVNSAYRDDYIPPATPSPAPHHGAFARESEEFLSSQAEEIRAASPKFRVLVVHHHLLPMADWDPYWADFSIMQNSDALLEFIASVRIDLVIHGHKHWPRLRRYQNAPGPLVQVLGAGSFSAEIHESLSSKVYNKFHLVNLEGRDDSSNACGAVHSWSYYAGTGWRPSDRNGGIAHKEPFGYYRDDAAVLAATRAAYASAKVPSSAAVDVADVLAHIPQGEFIAERHLEKALMTIATEAGAMVVTDSATGRRFIYGAA